MAIKNMLEEDDRLRPDFDNLFNVILNEQCAGILSEIRKNNNNKENSYKNCIQPV
jgi:hypothetical protein